jgi:hypothetical protein
MFVVLKKIPKPNTDCPLEEINLFLCLIKHHAMKSYEGVEVGLHAPLTSELDGH